MNTNSTATAGAQLANLNRHAMLDAWLDQRAAKLVWSRDLDREGNNSIECYLVEGYNVLVRRVGSGWDIFTSLDSLEIPASLHDAELRTGMVSALPDHVHVDTVKIPSILRDAMGAAAERRINLCRFGANSAGVKGSTCLLALTPDDADALAMALLAASTKARSEA